MLRYFPSGPFETNAYLLFCPVTKKGAVVDVPFDSAEPMIRLAQQEQVSIQMILLTHSHWDHIAEVAILKERLGIPVYIHAEDADNLRNPGSDRLLRPRSFQGVEPDGFLEEGQIILLGNLKIQVIYTPGHTPGGVCFFLEKEGILLSGDTLFQGAIGNLSFPTARPERMKHSLIRLLGLPPSTQVYPGHGDPTILAEETTQIRTFLGGGYHG